MKTVKELREKEATAPRKTHIIFSTSQGRAIFPELLQSAFGDKRVIGFDRYGRIMGAVVPIEAVRLLAGLEADVEEDTRMRIIKAARALLSQIPQEAARVPAGRHKNARGGRKPKRAKA